MAHLSDRQKAELVRQHQDGVPWTRIAEHSGVAVRTLQRWAARMETGQLSRAPRSDKGSRHIDAELVKAIEALAVRRPAPTIAYIHRRIGDIARACRIFVGVILNFGPPLRPRARAAARPS